jgi:uncharacterized protein YaiE (UPF0345 family)
VFVVAAINTCKRINGGGGANCEVFTSWLAVLSDFKMQYFEMTATSTMSVTSVCDLDLKVSSALGYVCRVIYLNPVQYNSAEGER